VSTLGATAMQQGLQSCEVCGLLSRPAPGDDDPRCPRCDEELAFRKPGSVQRTWALLIAAAALYALLAYSVNQRTHEIGVRVALGAQRTQVFQMVLRHAALLALIGLILGGTAAWFSAKILQSFLYGVSGHDTLTMGAVAAVLLSVCLLASFLPARRAASVDPMIALRHE